MKLRQLGISTLGIILVVILLLLLLGSFPTWPHGGFAYGYGAPGLITIILIIVVVLLLTGRL